jgi:hypothetical protein
LFFGSISIIAGGMLDESEEEFRGRMDEEKNAILAELEALELLVTPGPWRNDSGNGEVETEKYRTAICSRAGNYDRMKEVEQRYSGEKVPEEIIKELSYDNEMDMYFIALARNHMKPLLEEVRLLRDAIDHKSTGIKDFILMERENQKLRAELAAARDALVPFSKLGCSDINCQFRDNDYGTNGGCRCNRPGLKERSDRRSWIVKVNTVMKNIDESGLLK